jgi:hypothetical protein
MTLYRDRRHQKAPKCRRLLALERIVDANGSSVAASAVLQLPDGHFYHCRMRNRLAGGANSMSSEKQYRRFAAASLDLSERGMDLANKTRVLIVAEAWLDLAERTTPLVERESGEAHRIIERPLSNVTTPRYRSAAD